MNGLDAAYISEETGIQINLPNFFSEAGLYRGLLAGWFEGRSVITLMQEIEGWRHNPFQLRMSKLNSSLILLAMTAGVVGATVLATYISPCLFHYDSSTCLKEKVFLFGGIGFYVSCVTLSEAVRECAKVVGPNPLETLCVELRELSQKIEAAKTKNRKILQGLEADFVKIKKALEGNNVKYSVPIQDANLVRLAKIRTSKNLSQIRAIDGLMKKYSLAILEAEVKEDSEKFDEENPAGLRSSLLFSEQLIV